MATLTSETSQSTWQEYHEIKMTLNPEKSNSPDDQDVGFNNYFRLNRAKEKNWMEEFHKKFLMLKPK